MTYSYALMQLSKAAYDEIKDKMTAAGYDHAFDGQVISMQGIGIEPELERPCLVAPPVDPWMRQALLMDISDQQRPKELRVGSGALLYLALKLEEMGETIAAFEALLSRTGDFPPDAGPAGKDELDVAIEGVEKILDSHRTYASNTVDLAGQLNHMANEIRRVIKEAGRTEFAYPIELEYARPLADGVTDEAVVNAGFAASLGLPGGPLYAAVNESNLSKANPLTGKIDKDPSGKWIKGAGYKLPDIDGILGPLVPNDASNYF